MRILYLNKKIGFLYFYLFECSFKYAKQMLPTLALLDQILHEGTTIINLHYSLFKAISLTY